MRTAVYQATILNTRTHTRKHIHIEWRYQATQNQCAVDCNDNVGETIMVERTVTFCLTWMKRDGLVRGNFIVCALHYRMQLFT